MFDLIYPDFERSPGGFATFFAMSSNFDCNLEIPGLTSSGVTERGLRFFDIEPRFLIGDRLSLLFDTELSRLGDLLMERLRSRLGGDFRPLFLEVERFRRAGDLLSRFLETERSRRGGDDFLERLLSRRGGDFLNFLSLERLRLSLDRLRLLLSRERLLLSLTVLVSLSFDLPRERRTGLEFSSFGFSLASFFI